MKNLRTTLATIAIATAAEAAPVAVRIPEGAGEAKLKVAALNGTRLADGQHTQTIEQGNVVNRLTLRFRDGSLFDETVVFSQQDVFRLLSYAVVERGPSFSANKEIAFARADGRYRVKWREHDEDQAKTYEDDIEIPDDAYNGMMRVVVANAGEKVRGHMLVFIPQPHVLDLSVVLEGTDTLEIGGETRRAQRYLVDLEVSGFTGILARAIGKQPPDIRYWLAEPKADFLKFEGAMDAGAPVWRVEQE